MTIEASRFSWACAFLLVFVAFLAVEVSSLGNPGHHADAGALLAAYPDELARIEGGALVWRDGTRMPLSDGSRPKTFDELLENPDIEDMFRLRYAPGPMAGPPAVDDDPGRFRNGAFFAKMYGDCRKGEVRARLRDVQWMPSHGGGTVKMTTVNHVADRLEAVVRDLEKLPANEMRFLVPSAGTVNCRTVAGEGALSMHAYGAAIDINTKYADYWRWTKKASGPVPYRNRIPFDIVAIFERHGFIWGGKWYHYDTMHFEYRPELLRMKG